MKMQMIPPILNDTGDCCCQNCPQCNNCGCVPGGDGCICQGDKSGNSIESAITCDLVWKERQLNGKYKYYKVVSGSSQQNMPVVLPTASLTKRGVVQLTNELSDREDLALTPKGAKVIKTELDKEVADRVANDNALQGQLNQEKVDRANADTDLLNKINQEKADRTGADKTLSDRITQETADRKKADSDLSNRITSAESKADSAVSKADSAVSKANKAVTDVTSDGNATVTVTKADGTSSNFTINNVAHASSADSATTATTATNANHATSADTATKATNADHATVADRLASGSELDTSTLIGLPNWSKYKVTTIQDSVSQSSTLFTNKYTCDCNCLIELDGTTTVAPEMQYRSALKVNDTTINTWDISTLSGTGEIKSNFLNRAFLFKKGDVISLNIDQLHNGGQTIIKLNILPLE